MPFLMKLTIEQAYSIASPTRADADAAAAKMREDEEYKWRATHDGATPKVSVEVIDIGDPDVDLAPEPELRLHVADCVMTNPDAVDGSCNCDAIERAMGKEHNPRDHVERGSGCRVYSIAGQNVMRARELGEDPIVISPADAMDRLLATMKPMLERKLADWESRGLIVLRRCKSPWHPPECPGNLGPQCQNPNDGLDKPRRT